MVNRSARATVVSSAFFMAGLANPSEAFSPLHACSGSARHGVETRVRGPQHLQMKSNAGGESNPLQNAAKLFTNAAATAAFGAALLFHAPAALAENELSDKYGGGFDSSLVDQTCLVDKCSLQAKACLADDPSCRKGLTCTAKCLGDNACITGCMARYGDKNLDNLLKCTIEDNECIKVAILDGGSDKYGEEPRAPAPTVRNFDLASMQGSWYKVVGFNPNYDCYACQKNTFSTPFNNGMAFSGNNQLEMDVEFSMPHLLPDGSPPPPKNVKENFDAGDDGLFVGGKSIAFNDYATHEVMVFDSPKTPLSAASNLVLGKGDDQASYARTAHSEGEMFGLKFWENWYVLGENDPDEPEFKFVYYNGKTRQNTYSGAFVYSRARELPAESMAKVYQIAQDAGMNPDQFCKIRNGCFKEDAQPEVDPTSFRGIMASTRVSQLLGVEPVAAENIKERTSIAKELNPPVESQRPWWYEVGDYLENPHRHFAAMDDLRVAMEWPEDVKTQ